MLVFKKKHISSHYTEGGEWMWKPKGEFEEYIGPMVKYRKEYFVGEELTQDVFLNKKLVKFVEEPSLSEYDNLKPKYSKKFIEPEIFIYQLRDKDLEEGKYKKFFCYAQHLNEVKQISSETFKYLKKQNTPYHKFYKFVELKLGLNNSDYDMNVSTINIAAEIIPDLKKYLSADDYLFEPFRSNVEQPYIPKIDLP
jgi:hypothetical protein